MDDIIKIGERIKTAREKANLTLNDVAQKVGVASSTIQRYENGKIKKIKLPVIHSISNVLKVDPMWILGKLSGGIVLTPNGPYDAEYTSDFGEKHAIEIKSKLPPQISISRDSNQCPSYYLDEESAQIAQAIYNDPKLKLLFDTTRKVDPEDLEFITIMVKKMVKKESGEEE